MVELLETRFFALLAGESFEEITKEVLENELGQFVEEVARLFVDVSCAELHENSIAGFIGDV